MRPNDLQISFLSQEKAPRWIEEIFYIPNQFQHCEMEASWNSLFSNDFPICMEYCAGNGSWIVERALKNPQLNWIAVEMRFDRVKQIWSKLKNHGLKNLIIVCGEALAFSRCFLKANVIDAIYINFPDPWPKRRHHKHRLIQTPFIDQMFRILKDKKRITFVTDDFHYLTSAISLFLKHPRFQAEIPSPFHIKCPVEYGTSWFDTLWREQGKDIYYTAFQKMDSDAS